MGKSKVLKIFIILLFLPLYNLKGQDLADQKKLITNSFFIFCDTIISKEPFIQNRKFYFSGFSSLKYSDIKYIAICNEDITFEQSWKINESDLTKCHNINKEKIKEKLKLPRNKLPTVGWFRYTFSNCNFAMEVRQPVKYDNFYFVEIYLLNRDPTEIIIILKFNKELKFQNYCLYYIDLD